MPVGGVLDADEGVDLDGGRAFGGGIMVAVLFLRIVVEAGAEAGGVNCGLLMVAEGEGAGEFLEVGIGEGFGSAALA